MGVHQLVSNNKRTKRQKSNYGVAKQKKKIRKLKRGIPAINLADIELLSEKQVKHKISHPRCNISVSGKRKRKMLKRLRHGVQANNKMEVDEGEIQTKSSVRDVEMSNAVGKRKKKMAKSISKTNPDECDVEMDDQN